MNFWILFRFRESYDPLSPSPKSTRLPEPANHFSRRFFSRSMVPNRIIRSKSSYCPRRRSLRVHILFSFKHPVLSTLIFRSLKNSFLLAIVPVRWYVFPMNFKTFFGDATMRKALTEHNVSVKMWMFLAATVLLFGYGLFLNLAPVKFEKVVGLYIATLFIVWQVASYFSFGTKPTLVTLISGMMIVGGGYLLTFRS